MPRRWIRLDVDWDSSEWVYGLSDRAQLAWIKLCCHAKKSGQAGHVRALAPKVMAGQFRTTVRAVEEMLKAAQEDGALKVVDGNWVLTNWRKYQPKDRTAADRKKRERDRKKHAKRTPKKVAVTDSHGESRTVTPGHGASRRDTVARDRDVDVDVKASSRDEASPVEERVADAVAPAPAGNGKKGPPPSPPSWVAAACDVWAERLGVPNGGRIGKALRPAAKKHGEAEVLRVWRYYVAHEKPDYANPQTFAAKFLAWQRKAGSPPPAPTDLRDGLREALAQVLRQDPEFGGGRPDVHRTGIDLKPQWEAAWDEILREAGLPTIAEVAQ